MTEPPDIQPDIFATVLAKVRHANAALAKDGVIPAGLDYTRIVVEPPRDPAHGDMATNAAMVLAKDAGKKPRDLAEAIAVKLRADALIDTVAVAGPGFINLTLRPAAWIGALRAVLMKGGDYGRSTLGKGSVFAFDVKLPAHFETGAEHDASRIVGLAADQAAPRILAVDDTEANRALLARHLDPDNPTFAGRFQAMQQAFIARGIDPWTARDKALKLLEGIVSQQAAAARGVPFDAEADAAMRALVEKQVEEQSLAYFTSGLGYDDGVIDPRDTRTILGICLSAIHSAPVAGARGYGVFRL